MIREEWFECLDVIVCPSSESNSVVPRLLCVWKLLSSVVYTKSCLQCLMGKDQGFSKWIWIIYDICLMFELNLPHKNWLFFTLSIPPSFPYLLAFFWEYLLIYFQFFKIHFYWRIVALQFVLVSMYNKVNLLYIYIYPLFCQLPSH